jgi:hypothetical protein
MVSEQVCFRPIRQTVLFSLSECSIFPKTWKLCWNLEQSMGARIWVGIGLSYRLAMAWLHGLADSIPGLLKSLKILSLDWLRIRQYWDRRWNMRTRYTEVDNKFVILGPILWCWIGAMLQCTRIRVTQVYCIIVYSARFCKHIRSPGIDSKELSYRPPPRRYF